MAEVLVPPITSLQTKIFVLILIRENSTQLHVIKEIIALSSDDNADNADAVEVTAECCVLCRKMG